MAITNSNYWLKLFGQPSAEIEISVERHGSISAARTASSLTEIHAYLKPPPIGDVVRVATVMASLGLASIPYRFLIFVSGPLIQVALNELEEFVSETALTVGAVVCVPACAVDRPSDTGSMLFVDSAQYGHLRHSLGLSGLRRFRLKSGQLVTASEADKSAKKSAASELPKPYLVQALTDIRPRNAKYKKVQGYPLNELPPELVSNKPQHVCFLNKEMQSTRRRCYVSLSNPDKDGVLSELQLSISAIPVYTDSVPEGRIGIHETLLKSIGVRPGEPINFDETHTLVPRLESRVFAFRQAIARAGYSHSVDVGYAVARIPDRLLDVIGIEAGQTVIVQGLRAREIPQSRPARIRVRALPMREADTDSPAFRGLHAELGVQDIEIVGLDLLRRQELAVQPGTPIIIRPALSSLLAQEVLPISLAFATAIIGGVAQSQPIIVGIISVLFIVFVVGLLLRRFR